jgi:hypothetical protein
MQTPGSGAASLLPGQQGLQPPLAPLTGLQGRLNAAASAAGTDFLALHSPVAADLHSEEKKGRPADGNGAAAAGRLFAPPARPQRPRAVVRK